MKIVLCLLATLPFNLPVLAQKFEEKLSFETTLDHFKDHHLLLASNTTEDSKGQATEKTWSKKRLTKRSSKNVVQKTSSKKCHPKHIFQKTSSDKWSQKHVVWNLSTKTCCPKIVVQKTYSKKTSSKKCCRKKRHPKNVVQKCYQMITQKGFYPIVDISTGSFLQQSYHHYHLMTIFGNKIDTMSKSLFFYSGKLDMAKNLL